MIPSDISFVFFMLSSKQSKYGTFFMHRLSNLGMSFPKLAALPRPFSRQPTFAFRCRFCLRILTSFPSRQNQQFDKKKSIRETRSAYEIFVQRQGLLRCHGRAKCDRHEGVSSPPLSTRSSPSLETPPIGGEELPTASLPLTAFILRIHRIQRAG